jgi:hypothetical protein
MLVLMPSDKPVLSFVVDEDLLKHLDDFRFTNRFQVRATAIEWSLDQKPKVEQA